MSDLLLPLQTVPAPASDRVGTPVVAPAVPAPAVLAPGTAELPPAVLPARSLALLVPAVADVLASAAGLAGLVAATREPAPQVLLAVGVLWLALLLRQTRLCPPSTHRARLQRLRSTVQPAGLVALAGCITAEVPGSVLPPALSSGTDFTAGQALALAAALAVPVALGRLLTPLPAPAPVIVAGASPTAVDHVGAAFRRAQPCGVVVDVRLTDVPDDPAGTGPSGERSGGGRQSCALVDLAGLAADTGARTVVVVPSGEDHPPLLRRLQWELETSGRRLLLAPGPLDVAPTRAATWHVDGQPLVEVRPSRHAARTRYVLSVPERAVAALAIMLLAPVLLAVAVLVRLDSAGPALFRQVRVGRGGREFVMYKFRTMHSGRVDQASLDNDADGVLFKNKRDPRITRVGAVLRRYSVDELPQLLNVVVGDMSLVGPRPALPSEVAAYEPDTHRRLAVRPGITGLWQVSGRSDLSWQDTVRLDLSYVDNWSLLLDLRILWRTAGAVLSHRGAY